MIWVVPPTVLGVMGISSPVNLRVVITATDNKVNSGAIFQMMSSAMDGQTIEIESTDAEVV